MTRKEPKLKRVADVVDAAVDEFVRKGYEGASMQSIAARAGLTKGGLYHHFRSKDEILLAANLRFMEPVQAMIGQAFANPSPLDGLRAYVRAYLAYWSGHPRDLAFTLLSLHKALMTPDMWPPMADYVEQMIAFFQGMLDRAVAAGEVRAHDSRGRALAMLAALDGVIAYLVMDPRVSPPDAATHFERVFLDELVPIASGSSPT